MSKLRLRHFVGLLAGTVAFTAGYAGPFPPIAFIAMGYQEATLTSLTGSAHYNDRLVEPSGFLSVTADFNGDGKDDEARILINASRGDARVVIVIMSPDKVDTYVLASAPANSLDTLGIRLEAPDQGAGRALPGLVVFRFGGRAELNTFNGEEFDPSPLPVTGATPTS